MTTVAATDQRTIAARNEWHAVHRPDAVALVFEDRVTTFRELYHETNRTAHALLAAGLRRGSRVGYLGRESDHYFTIALACAKVGAVVVPVNWRLTPPEVDHILRDSGAELLFVEKEFLPVLDRIRGELPALSTVVRMDTDAERGAGFVAWRSGCPATAPDVQTGMDDAVGQMYTSGTTGLPKGVVLANRHCVTFIEDMRAAGLDWIDWRPEDRSLTCFPGLHAGGYTWFMHCMNVGATVVVMRAFVPADAVRLIEKHRVTTVWAAPAMLRMILDEESATPERLSSLRKVVYGGSPIDSELQARCMAEFPCDVVQGYASAETGSFVTALTGAEHVPGNPKLGSAGRVLPGCSLKIISESGETLPPGRPGRICLRSPAAFLGYWNRPDATAEMVRDGWLWMGDVGYLDDDGYLYLRDRLNDTIIVAGQNIYPVEIENALRDHPDVADVAVYGVPDRRWGEQVRAAVVPRDGATVTGRELVRFLRGRIADYKIPYSYRFVDELPRNPTGKVLRRVLRDQAAEESP
jgi:fatty-acyl-CoA synthase